MFFHTVEFYVLLFVGTALVVGLIAIPRNAGPAREHLVGSRLICADPSEPQIEAICQDNGNLILSRRGLVGVHLNGAVSAKIEVRGEHITVHERIIPGRPDPEDDDIATEAQFTLDFLAAERYYLRYESEHTSSYATLTFRNVAGYHAGPAPFRQ